MSKDTVNSVIKKEGATYNYVELIEIEHEASW